MRWGMLVIFRIPRFMLNEKGGNYVVLLHNLLTMKELDVSLDAQHVMKPHFLLRECEFVRLTHWSITKHRKTTY